MPYKKAKVYNDGGHYIAIPQTKRPKRPKKEVCKGKETQTDSMDKTENKKSAEPTIKDEFDRLYKEYANSPKNERKQRITRTLAPKFKNSQALQAFVENNIERMERNKIIRRIRLMRKVNLQQWNYFCTFTYSDEKHTEETFQKGLMNCLRHQASRKEWKYIGAWERSPNTNRLHFHAIVYIPDGKMIGEIITVRDYDTVEKRMQETFQNTHFLKEYGRNDFKPINPMEISDCVKYLLKYIEKGGGRLVYSRGLYMYFVSDIMDEDIVCPYGVGDMKLLLFDNSYCIKDGEIVGQVSPEVIKQMPKAN